MIGVALIPLPVLTAFLGIDPFMKVAAVISVYLVHAQPIGIGFWAGRELRRINDEKKWRRNVDNWLGEWECQASEEELPGEPP
jgi:hypothetical protein